MYRKERHVKPRRYDSGRRRAQARETRRAILDAARRLFLDRGYAETTVPSVAAEAGVSVETIYKAFANKVGLIKAVFDVATWATTNQHPCSSETWSDASEPSPILDASYGSTGSTWPRRVRALRHFSCSCGAPPPPTVRQPTCGIRCWQSD